MTRLSVVATMTALLILFSASVAMACRTPQPPPVRDLDATSCLYGDPRARENIVNNGNVTATAKITYNTGKANRRQVLFVTLDPGETRSLKLWAHGQTWVRVRDALTGELLTSIFVTRSNISASCPRPVQPA